MSKRRNNNLTSILLLLVIVLAVGFVYRYTNGFNEDFKTFYIEYNGERILTSNSEMVLGIGNEHRFDVKYTFGKNTEKNKGYTVKIIPNADKDNSFDFTINGNKYAYYGESELTDAFDITLEESYFVISLPSTMTIESILKDLYPNDEVTVPEEAYSINYPFTLIIASYNEKVVYNIDFGFEVMVMGIELSAEEIYF
ncbi:MAG: hypothetical protein E7348_03130 [Clostridiales bacterium]|nr:hypothetical protein [Clostridiales bacterium]